MSVDLKRRTRIRLDRLDGIDRASDSTRTELLSAAMAQFQHCIEHRDLPAAEQVLDEDYALVLVLPERAVMRRDRWLELLPDYVVHEYAVEEQVVDESADLAVVLQRARMRATVLGVDRSGVFVVSDVWRRHDGAWQLWRRHSSPLSAAALAGADRVLRTYPEPAAVETSPAARTHAVS